MVALASFANANTKVVLIRYLYKLGIDVIKAKIIEKAIQNFQSERNFTVIEAYSGRKSKGLIIGNQITNFI